MGMKKIMYRYGIDNECRLTENMAVSKHKIWEILANQGKRDMLVMHLMCIYFHYDEQCAGHWIKEIAGMIPNVPKWRGNNKRPDKDTIYKIWWEEEVEDVFDDYYNYILDQNKNVRETELEWSEAEINDNKEDFHTFLVAVLHKFCEIMENEIVKTDHVQDILRNEGIPC